MVFLSIITPLLISFFIGYFLILLMAGKKQKIDSVLLLFLAVGLGLGISAYLAFLSFMFCNEFNRPFIIGSNILLLAGLAFKQLYHRSMDPIDIKPLKANVIFIALLGIFFLILYQYARFYPYGGWDAWQVWNFKARFLFLSGQDWQNMFDPTLWRSSPHYPLLLPLINVWVWSFLPVPLETGPMVVSILFTLLVAGLVASGLKSFIPAKIAILAPLLFLTLPFYVLLAISQYSDITLAYFALAVFLCLMGAKRNGDQGLALLAGTFVGFLSFTKPEGTIAALLLIFLSIPYLLYKTNDRNRASLAKFFCLAALAAFIPTLLFHGIYSPGNQTFINGLTSQERPADFYRFKFILIYSYQELCSEKWHMLWVLLALGAIFSRRQAFRREIALIPLFLFSYLGIIGIYYFINTYFKIEWWMQVTLNRILFSLLPIVVFWIFYSLWQPRRR